MESTTYLHIFDQIGEPDLTNLLDFEFNTSFVSPYVSGGHSEFTYFINFIKNHPDIFKPTLDQIFGGNNLE